MTLRLVTSDDIAINAEPTMAEEISQLADDIEHDAATLVTITLGEGWSQIRVLGEQMSNYSLMGIFEAAKFEVMSDLIEDRQ